MFSQMTVSAICSPLTTLPGCWTPAVGWLRSGWKSRVHGFPALGSNVRSRVEKLRGVLDHSLIKQQNFAPRYHRRSFDARENTPNQHTYHRSGNELQLPKVVIFFFIHIGTSYPSLNTYMYMYSCIFLLTHWGHMTHIHVGKLTIIGSDNGLSPGRRQAIIWTNVGILSNGPLGTNLKN